MAQTVLIKAPIAGTVADVRVKAGDNVANGALLAVQLVTKVESTIKAPCSGRVKSIVEKGASVAEGDILVEIEAD